MAKNNNDNNKSKSNKSKSSNMSVAPDSDSTQSGGGGGNNNSGQNMSRVPKSSKAPDSDSTQKGGRDILDLPGASGLFKKFRDVDERQEQQQQQDQQGQTIQPEQNQETPGQVFGQDQSSNVPVAIRDDDTGELRGYRYQGETFIGGSPESIRKTINSLGQGTQPVEGAVDPNAPQTQAQEQVQQRQEEQQKQQRKQELESFIQDAASQEEAEQQAREEQQPQQQQQGQVIDQQDKFEESFVGQLFGKVQEGVNALQIEGFGEEGGVQQMGPAGMLGPAAGIRGGATAAKAASSGSRVARTAGLKSIGSNILTKAKNGAKSLLSGSGLLVSGFLLRDVVQGGRQDNLASGIGQSEELATAYVEGVEKGVTTPQQALNDLEDLENEVKNAERRIEKDNLAGNIGRFIKKKRGTYFDMKKEIEKTKQEITNARRRVLIARIGEPESMNNVEQAMFIEKMRKRYGLSRRELLREGNFQEINKLENAENE